MSGVPMIATSPLRSDAASSVSAAASADVHAYEAPWKALYDFAVHSDLDKLNPNAPNYQQLVSQVRREILRRLSERRTLFLP